uniref:J domain-containing protein n=1 Tax=Panagrellus redivivus TaxID=6233 RepID=A0A7E4V2S9_PANRE
MKSYYDLLETTGTATQNELKQAYFACLRVSHPDKGASDLDHFNLLQKAYEVLRDPSKRKEYDAWLKEQLIRADDVFGIVDEFDWDSTCQTGDHLLESLPSCRCCGDSYLIESEDLDLIIDFAYFDCASCSVKLKILKV